MHFRASVKLARSAIKLRAVIDDAFLSIDRAFVLARDRRAVIDHAFMLIDQARAVSMTFAG